jgi:hypothetical protein
MDKKLQINHNGFSYFKRIKFLALRFILIILIFLILYLVDNGLKNILIPIASITFGAGIIIVSNIMRNKYYLIDFYSDSQVVKIKYYNRRKLFIKKTNLKDVEASIKNTTTRAGFNCELRLSIDNIKFTIEDTFEWSLSDIKQLFEYIKFHKKEDFTEMDDFNLSKIENKI